MEKNIYYQQIRGINQFTNFETLRKDIRHYGWKVHDEEDPGEIPMKKVTISKRFDHLPDIESEGLGKDDYTAMCNAYNILLLRLSKWKEPQ